MRACWKDLLEKYLVLHLKMVADLLEQHPFSFMPVMKESLGTICSLCFTNEGEGLLFQRFIILAFNILKQTLLCAEYKLPKQKEEGTKTLIEFSQSLYSCFYVDITGTPTYQAHCLKQEFFQPSTITEICKCLITTYLPLSKDDLELWDADPEQYGNGDDIF